jgi:hypothetical protein
VRRTALASLLLLAAAGTPLEAQDIGDELSALTEENAQGYVGPLARGLGHALTAGLVSSADPHGSLGFSIGVRAVGALFTDDDETFQVIVPTSVTYTHFLFGTRTYTNPYAVTNGGRSTTVIADGTVAELVPQGDYRRDLLLAAQNPDGRPYRFPLLEGKDIPAAPFAVIDGALGLGFGTQIMVRVIPTLDLGALVGEDEVGDISAFGAGIMHNLTQWLPIPTPMWDVSLTAGTQKMNLGDYLEASGNTFGLVASAGVGPLSAYAHASTYKADVDVDYTYTAPNSSTSIPIAFTETLDRTGRLAIGAQLNLLLLKLSAEYGMGDMKTVSGRVAIGLR